MASAVAASLTFAALLLATAFAPVFSAALILLFLLGAVGVAYRVSTTSLAQPAGVPAMRGRTMALFVIAVGGTSPVSAPLLGWLCEAVGVRATLAIGGLGSALTTLLLWIYLRRDSDALERAPAGCVRTAATEDVRARGSRS